MTVVPERLLNWFDERPTQVAFLGSAGAAVTAAGFQNSWGRQVVWIWLFGLLVFLALPAASARRNQLQQGRLTASRCLRRTLEACGMAFGHPDRHVRVNIMLVADRGRARVVNAFTAFNMECDPDQDLKLEANAGVSGEAFGTRRPVFGDLSIPLAPGGPKWGLNDAQKAKVRPTLSSILSVPVFDPQDADGQLLGTLQVDSDLPLSETKFDDPDRQALAEPFADVVALVLGAVQ